MKWLIALLIIAAGCTIQAEPLAPSDGLAAAATPVPTESGPSCPLGQADDHYPGKCFRYVDEDKDGVCDLSQ